MRLSTVGRIILAEVCIIFNNCSITESNDSLKLAKERKLGGLRSFFEGGEKWKNISMDFFFLVKVTRCALSVWFEISRPASQVGYNFCLRPSVLCRKKLRWYSLRGSTRKVYG